MIEITVYGTPGPQGSKSFKGLTKEGHGILVESSKLVKPWRDQVRSAFQRRYPKARPTIKAIRARDGRAAVPAIPGNPILRGPVTLEVVFFLKRPKRLRKKLDALPGVRPDMSKLVRSTEDALTDAGAWEDDSRVVNIISQKRYEGCSGGLPQQGAIIRLKEAA